MDRKYIFYYYWSHDRRPCPAKGVRDNNLLIGTDNAIKGAEWEISMIDFMNISIDELAKRYPFPFKEGEDE